MKVLNQSIYNLKFEDIVSFCQEKYVEGIQIDYKKDFPQKGLAKIIASFSNTRGGLVIVGVEEDDKGLPTKWLGMKNEGKLIDRVHQYAANVDPLPNYEVCVTDQKKGRVFLLIRVFEGNKTPYYVQNDSNIWIRTGNISKSIDIASPDALEMLFNKRKQAKLTRSLFITRTNEIYLAALKRADIERKKRIAIEKEKYVVEQKSEGVENPSLDGFKSTVITANLGSNVAMCTVLLQPYFPHNAFASPLELRDSIQSFRVTGNWFGSFPSLNAETIPEGIMNFSWREDNGQIECEQIYGHCLVYDTVDVLQVDENENQIFWMSSLGRILFATLSVARNLYQNYGYQGGVEGYLLLTNVEGVTINRIMPQGWHGFPEVGKCLLNKYRLDISTNTSILNEPMTLLEMFVELINKLYIGFNMAPPKKELLEAFLKDEGWLVEKETN